MKHTEITNNIVLNTLKMGYGSKDLISLRQLAWNCLPFSCFAGGVDTKVFDDISEAINILESEDK